MPHLKDINSIGQCVEIAVNIALDVLKLEGKGIKAVKQSLVSIAAVK